MKFAHLTFPMFASATILPKMNDNLERRSNITEAIPTSSTKAEPLCEKSIHNIHSTEQLNTLVSSCKTISGSVEVGKDYESSTLDFKALKGINGSLNIVGCPNLNSIYSNTLKSVTGEILLKNMTSLNSVHFPSLSFINSIRLNILPILKDFQIGADVRNSIKVEIADTALNDLTFLNQFREIEFMDINNNRDLKILELNHLSKVNNYCKINGNNPSLQLTLPTINHVGNLTIRDISSFSLPNLEKIDSSLDMHENWFSEIDLSKLNYIGGSYGVMNNQNLESLKIPALRQINGGLIITNNSKLNCIGNFSNLTTIGGGIHLEGEFNETEFPNLKVVKGGAFIKTTSEKFDCEVWVPKKTEKSLIRGGNSFCSSKSKTKFLEVGNNQTNSTFVKDHDSEHVASPTETTWEKENTSKEPTSAASRRIRGKIKSYKNLFIIYLSFILILLFL